MHIDNHLGFIFLGDIGGTWGGLWDKETGCKYQQVHKQPFSVYFFRGHGGDLGNRRGGVGIKVYINNNLGVIFLGAMGGTWG